MRVAFHQVECPLRPRIFLAMPLEDGRDSDVEAAGQASGLEESMSSSPDTNLEITNVLYLKMDAAIRGVLQVHQAGSVRAAIPLQLNIVWLYEWQVAEERHIEGYRFLLRCEELWRLQRRQQPFFNWFSKLLLVNELRSYDLL